MLSVSVPFSFSSLFFLFFIAFQTKNCETKGNATLEGRTKARSRGEVRRSWGVAIRGCGALRIGAWSLLVCFSLFFFTCQNKQKARKSGMEKLGGATNRGDRSYLSGTRFWGRGSARGGEKLQRKGWRWRRRARVGPKIRR